MYCALTAELQIHQSPEKMSLLETKARNFLFFENCPSLSIRKRKHIMCFFNCCVFLAFWLHIPRMYDCELLGAYNIYNITFGNCDKDNRINCHDLLSLSSNKNLKINKKTRFPIKNPTVCVYVYIHTYIYIQATIRELSSTTLDYMEGIPGIPRYTSQSFGPNLDAWEFPKKKKVIPASSLNQLRMTQD